ncbi:MAG: hypothetical protein WCZ87_13765, partial [Thiohalobacteraceae bacterium]
VKPCRLDSRAAAVQTRLDITRSRFNIPMQVIHHGPVMGCLALLAAAPVASVASGPGPVSTGIDAEAGLPYWELSTPGMSVRLVQRLPDQTRGFFLARGLPREAVEKVAQRCVFQTVFKNDSQTGTPSALEYNLRDWVVAAGDVQRGMKTREDWAEEWAHSGVSQPARIAFEWALFPTRQVYNPGDYNWGMSVFDVAPGTIFDLELVWRQYGEVRSATIERVQCAPDEPYAPEES